MEPIKVLIVDDSFFMRQAIAKLIECDEIKVIDSAKNGKEGVEKTLALKPDVITMDIEMPVMTGIEALKEIMEKQPTPVLMVSTLTTEGAESTMDALSHGAVDFITKKSAFKEMDSLKEELINKIKTLGKNSNIKHSSAFRRKIQQLQSAQTTDASGKSYTAATSGLISKPRPRRSDIDIVAVGVSTGGPVALRSLLFNLPAQFPVPIVIAQHMPAQFTSSLANRLNSSSELTIKEASTGDRLRPGYAFLAPGGKQMHFTNRGIIEISDKPTDSLFKPSVNVMMESLMDVYKNRILGLMMTGMGNDGMTGFRKLSEIGGYNIVQDIDSCVVAGMVKSVISARAANESVPLERLATTLCNIMNAKL